MGFWIPRVSIPSTDILYSRILSEEDIGRLLLEHGAANYMTVTVSIVAWSSLLGDSPFDVKPNRVINKFINNLVDNYKSVSQNYASLADRLSRSVKHDHAGNIIIIDDFIVEFKNTPIFREYLEFFNKHDPLLLRYILSFLLFGKKIGYIDEDLDIKALRLWYQVEERLERAELPQYVADLRYILEWMFKDWSVQDLFLPTHGTGSVAERGVWGSNGKNKAFSLDPKLSYLYDRVSDEDLYSPTPTGTTQPIKDVRLSVARLKFVPKDLKKTRSICMEPVDFQWAQQGVRLWYETWMENCILRNHVFLKDQSFNQILCWHGSISSDLATLDLSSASDSVSLDLVKAIFPSKVLKHLLGTRSRFVEVPDKEAPIRVKKFAPMGSALCFPVQCTVYSAVMLMVSIAQSYGRNIWKGDTITDINLDQAYFVLYGNSAKKFRHYHRFFAYGDDLICDKQIVSNTIRTLKELSFEINEDKSYIDNTAYRESCGKHYYNGYDVTPYILKIAPLTQRITLEVLGGLIDAANRSIVFGYKCLYSALVNVCLHYPLVGVISDGPNPVLFVEESSDESFAIRCRDPRNTHLRRRDFNASDVVPSLNDSLFNEKRIIDRWSHQLYQRDEYQSISVEPLEYVRGSEKFDPYYHTLWWRARYHRDDDEGEKPSSMKADTKGVSVRWRWTAV